MRGLVEVSSLRLAVVTRGLVIPSLIAPKRGLVIPSLVAPTRGLFIPSLGYDGNFTLLYIYSKSSMLADIQKGPTPHVCD